VVTGKGTVFTSMIMQGTAPGVPSGPREIMQWTAEMYGRALANSLHPGVGTGPRPDTLQAGFPHDPDAMFGIEHCNELAQCSSRRGWCSWAHGAHGGMFSLQDVDYCFGDLKVGGNAQSITRGRWVHHTSFLADYKQEDMDLLSLPQNRPEYRGDRTHSQFLTTLRQEMELHKDGVVDPVSAISDDVIHSLSAGLGMWFDAVEEVSEEDAWKEAGLGPDDAEDILRLPRRSEQRPGGE